MSWSKARPITSPPAQSKVPGVQVVFWVMVNAQKVKMETVQFTEATGEEADSMLRMDVNKLSCVMCREELHDRYESGDQDPMCQKCFLSTHRRRRRMGRRKRI